MKLNLNLLCSIELGDGVINLHIYCLPIPDTNQFWKRQMVQLCLPSENNYHKQKSSVELRIT